MTDYAAIEKEMQKEENKEYQRVKVLKELLDLVDAKSGGNLPSVIDFVDDTAKQKEILFATLEKLGYSPVIVEEYYNPLHEKHYFKIKLF